MNALTRKAGPLPVWAWAGLAVAAWFLFPRGGGTKTTQLPYTPRAPRPPAVSGQGAPVDNGNADLLAALSDNAAASDQLLAALQTVGTGGGYGSPAATGAGSSSSAPLPAANTTIATDAPAPGLAPSEPVAPSTGGADDGSLYTAALTAPTVTTVENNAPVVQPAGSYVGDVTVQTAVGPVSYSGFTQDPAAVDASGGYVNGIVPAVNYVVGQGGSVDPILESASVPARMFASASTVPENQQNAITYAARHGQVVTL